jgi:hypothetical protein
VAPAACLCACTVVRGVHGQISVIAARGLPATKCFGNYVQFVFFLEEATRCPATATRSINPKFNFHKTFPVVVSEEFQRCGRARVHPLCPPCVPMHLRPVALRVWLVPQPPPPPPRLPCPGRRYVSAEAIDFEVYGRDASNVDVPRPTSVLDGGPLAGAGASVGGTQSRAGKLASIGRDGVRCPVVLTMMTPGYVNVMRVGGVGFARGGRGGVTVGGGAKGGQNPGFQCRLLNACGAAGHHGRGRIGNRAPTSAGGRGLLQVAAMLGRQARHPPVLFDCWCPLTHMRAHPATCPVPTVHL